MVTLKAWWEYRLSNAAEETRLFQLDCKLEHILSQCNGFNMMLFFTKISNKLQHSNVTSVDVTLKYAFTKPSLLKYVFCLSIYIYIQKTLHCEQDFHDLLPLFHQLQYATQFPFNLPHSLTLLETDCPLFIHIVMQNLLDYKMQTYF